MTLVEVYKSDGIRDIIPTAARALFAKAWMAEYNGDYESAASLLDAAVQAETDHNAKS